MINSVVNVNVPEDIMKKLQADSKGARVSPVIIKILKEHYGR